jgi:hypothetical protein
VQRLRLFDIKLSDFPQALGFCQGDTARIAKAANTCNRRLLYAKEAGEEGWWGTWAEILFTVSRTLPYITLPREVARLELVDVCGRARPVQNQFYEYLRFGNGRLPKLTPNNHQNLFRLTEAYTRNNVPTFTDLSNAPQFLAVYMTDPADFGKRVLLQGTDNNGSVIYSQDGTNPVMGEYVNLRMPFITSVNRFNTITGIQKDITLGQIQIFQVDPTTGAQVLLVTMEPSEQTASYRRYFFNPLPLSCCPVTVTIPPQPITVTAIAKLDFIPMQVDQDYSLIQSIDALTEEAQSMRLGFVDNKSSKAMAQERHIQAIRYLMGEVGHFVGIDQPAVAFRPFGSARLERQRIGTMI